MIPFALCRLQNMLVSFPICLALLRFLSEDRVRPVFDPPYKTGQTGEREDVQGLEHLAGEEASGTSFAQPGAGKAEEAAGWGLQPLESERTVKG